MTETASAGDHQRQRLHRMRLLATAMLAVASALFILSCLKQTQYPALAYLKAFSEAAMVGALADWFAVTALFRHPLGVPIPHTAILPQKQDKIADELGQFIKNNFLQDKAIAKQIYQLHPATQILSRLNHITSQQQWLPHITEHIPTLLRTIKGTDIIQISTRLLKSQHSGAKLGSILANLLTQIHQQNIDTNLLRILLQQIRNWLQNEKTRALLEKSLITWVGKIEKNNPNNWDKLKTALKINLTTYIDDWISNKALNWADSYIETILENQDHPFWRTYRKQLLHIKRQLNRNPFWHKHLITSLLQFTQSKAIQHNLDDLWHKLTRWSETDIQQNDSWWQQQLSQLLNHIQHQAQQNPQLMRRLNIRATLCVRNAVRKYKNRAALFIANKVKSWDSKQMINKLELSVGRDLQFIRINGTVVGGLIGVIIYTLSQWLTP